MCKGSYLLLKGFLFISLISSCYVHAEDVIENAQKKLLKIPVTNFVVKIEKVYDYNLALLVKNKTPFIKGKMSGEYLEKWTQETSETSSFIKNLKGTITIYSPPRKTIVYRIILPNKNATDNAAQKSYFGLNNTAWNGIILPVVKINKNDHYIIEFDLYSDNPEYKDLMIAFTPIIGPK